MVKANGAIGLSWALALFTAASLTAPATAEEPPDYVGFSQQADRLAFVVASMKSCTNFGYPDVQQPLLDRMQKLIDEAELSGISVTLADSLIANAVEAENARLAARTKDLERRKDDPAAMESFLDYWEQRCEALASDPDYGHLFKR